MLGPLIAQFADSVDSDGASSQQGGIQHVHRKESAAIRWIALGSFAWWRLVNRKGFNIHDDEDIRCKYGMFEPKWLRISTSNVVAVVKVVIVIRLIIIE